MQESDGQQHGSQIGLLPLYRSSVIKRVTRQFSPAVNNRNDRTSQQQSPTTTSAVPVASFSADVACPSHLSTYPGMVGMDSRDSLFPVANCIFFIPTGRNAGRHVTLSQPDEFTVPFVVVIIPWYCVRPHCPSFFKNDRLSGSVVYVRAVDSSRSLSFRS